MNKMMSDKKSIAFFILPELVVFTFVVIYSIATSFFYSLHTWDGITDKVFVGFQNYISLFVNNSDGFLRAIINPLILALLSVTIQLPLALFLAIVLARGIKGSNFFRTAFFVPVLFSSVVMGQLWSMIYNPTYGLLNQILENLGIIDSGIAWLGDKRTALLCTFIAMIWKYIGYYMLLLYSAVKRIPADLFEAAEIDGANRFQAAWRIIIPLSMPAIKATIVMIVIGALKAFDTIYVLTNGGPDHATEVTSTLMYTSIFKKNLYGYGSSMAIFIVIECLLFTILLNFWKPKEYTY
ncbi:MAG: carbohydrate ABC transporter permease [Suipraeoptans sp.]